MKIKHATKSNLILTDRAEFPEYVGARKIVKFSRYRKSKFMLDDVIYLDTSSFRQVYSTCGSSFKIYPKLLYDIVERNL